MAHRGTITSDLLSRAATGAAHGSVFGVLLGLVICVATTVGGKALFATVLNPLNWATAARVGQIVLISATLGLGIAVAGLSPFKRTHRHLSVIVIGWLLVPLLTAPNLRLVHYLNILIAALVSHALLETRRYGAKFPLVAAFAIGLAVITWFGVRAAATPTAVLSADRPIPPPDATNVLLVVLDTTRADHLSIYGYDRQTTPRLEQFAGEGVVFTSAYATAPWTLPSHASMFTGLYVDQHRCDHGRYFLDPKLPVLAEILHAEGYDTGLFAGNPWLDSASGLSRGFETVQPSWRRVALDEAFMVGQILQRLGGEDVDKGARETQNTFGTWLDRQKRRGRPFFAVINYLEPHMPYFQIPSADRERFLAEDVSEKEMESVSTRFAARFLGVDGGSTPTQRDRKIVEALYDGGILHIDRRFGEIIKNLEQDGRLDKTLVIVTSDHGELFGDHGIFGHDLGLYTPLLQIPLVLRLPGRIPAGIRSDVPVSLVDLLPTVLEITGHGAKVPTSARGISLLQAIEGRGDARRAMLSEYSRPTLPWAVAAIRRMGFDPKQYDLRSVQVEKLRYVQGPGTLERLFDHETDLHEDQDLATSRPEQLATMRSILASMGGRDRPAGERQENVPTMDDATRERLKALGYLE